MLCASDPVRNSRIALLSRGDSNSQAAIGTLSATASATMVSSVSGALIFVLRASPLGMLTSTTPKFLRPSLLVGMGAVV